MDLKSGYPCNGRSNKTSDDSFTVTNELVKSFSCDSDDDLLMSIMLLAAFGMAGRDFGISLERASRMKRFPGGGRMQLIQQGQPF